MEKTKAIITSLWKNGYTQFATEYAREHKVSQDDFMTIISHKKKPMTRPLRNEMEMAPRFHSSKKAFQFIEDNLYNYIVVQQDHHALIIPEAYVAEIKELEYSGYTYNKGAWESFGDPSL